MPRKRSAGRRSAAGAAGAEPLRRKNFRLHQSKLDLAKKVLGTKTDTETIERALDLAIFTETLVEGTKRARGLPWDDVFGEMERLERPG